MIRTVAVTSHRTLEHGDPVWLREQLPGLCSWLIEHGVRFLVSGLALGTDTDLAETALDAGLLLCAAIPFEGQDARWNRAQKARYARVRAAAHREHVGKPVPDDLPPNRRSAVVNQRLHTRNRFMLDVAQAVVTDWEPGRLTGGTAETLREAARRGMPGQHLDPIGRTVNPRLPALAELEPFALQAPGCGHVTLVGDRTQVTARHTGLAAAGFTGWQVRPARSYERHDDGCETCLEQLAVAALSAFGRPEPVTARV